MAGTVLTLNGVTFFFNTTRSSNSYVVWNGLGGHHPFLLPYKDAWMSISTYAKESLQSPSFPS